MRDSASLWCQSAFYPAQLQSAIGANMARHGTGRPEAAKVLKNTQREAPGLSGEGRGVKLAAKAAPVERLLYGRKEAAVALSISPRAVDYELAQGAFETRRYGSRVLITARSLKQWANANHYRAAQNIERAA